MLNHAATTAVAPKRRLKRAAVAGIAAAALMTSTAIPTADAKPRSAVVTPLATFGSGLGSGSTIGPDGALYVTDGNAGAVWRIDRHTGEVTKFADGLPLRVLPVGGAMDVAFIGHT